MFGGRIVEIGTHEELLGNGGAYSALWHTWRGKNTVAEGPPGDILGRGDVKIPRPIRGAFSRSPVDAVLARLLHWTERMSRARGVGRSPQRAACSSREQTDKVGRRRLVEALKGGMPVTKCTHRSSFLFETY